MSKSLQGFELWLTSKAEGIENELEDIHPAAIAKSGHAQRLVNELEDLATAAKLLANFRTEGVCQFEVAHGVSGS